MPIRIALIGGGKENRSYARKRFAQMQGFEIVFEGNSPQTHFKSLRNARPDIILVTTGYPDTLQDELDPRFEKVIRRLPSAKIFVRTELTERHPFVQEAIRAGISIIGEGHDFDEIAKGMRRIAVGEQVVNFAPRSYDLETYHRSPKKEAF